MDKIAIGVPAYGGQLPRWWKPLAMSANELHKQDIELADILDASSMATDYNRNNIARRFLSDTDAEWLMWIDADNPLILGAIRRMLDVGQTLVTGLYGKRSSPPEPVAYMRNEDGTYRSLQNWRRGEIIPVDAAGLGCCLTHRSVYEDIDRAYVALQRSTGGIVAIQKSMVKGDISDVAQALDDESIVDGVWMQRVYIPAEKTLVPFFALEYGRTEDHHFFEKAASVGHKLWLDTSIEVAHMTDTEKTPEEYLAWMRKQ